MPNAMQNRPPDPWQREQWTLLTTSTMILAGVALAFMLWFTRSVMVPFVLGLFVVAVVAPISDVLESRARFPRWLSMLVVLLVVLIATLGFLLLLSYTAQEIYRSADRYVNNIDDWQQDVLEKGKEQLEGRLDEPPSHPNNDSASGASPKGASPKSITLHHESQELQTARPGAIKRTKSLWRRMLDSERMETAWQQLMEELKGVLIRFLKGTIGSAVGLFSTFTFMLIFVLFLLAGRTPAGAVSGVYAEVESNIRRYLATKTALSAITGILVTLILAYMGLELAVVFGVLTFMLNFIPSIGSIIATLLPLPIAYAQFASGWMLLWVLLLPGSVQMLIGNVIEPRIMGEGLDLHPITILFALTFWGLLWGPIGAILAVPITAIVRIAMARFQSLRPAAELMAGRFPVQG